MIRVIIERQIKPERCDDYFTLVRRAKRNAGKKPGFLGGEMLRHTDDDNCIVVIASWDSIDSWQQWNSSDERTELSEQIRPLLVSDERVTVLESGPQM